MSVNANLFWSQISPKVRRSAARPRENFSQNLEARRVMGRAKMIIRGTLARRERL
jgi:hypothetical protein